MPTVKHVLISFAATAIAVAVIFRVTQIRQLVTGSTT